MEQLKAFVGHSFNESDEKVNNIFLKYFDSLKNSIGLTYEHAESAEARELSKKVREKMKGKNLFIGIFTAKDLRLPADKIRKGRFPGKKKSFIEGDNVATSATSEWVIQESGYALGKGMNLLFLKEGGVTIYAGLQGDIEYVEFNRAKPTESFIKISESLGSIIKQLQREPTSEREEASPSEKETMEENENKREPEDSKERLKIEKFLSDIQSLKTLLVEKRDIATAEKELARIIQDHKGTAFLDRVYWEAKFLIYKMIIIRFII